LSSEQQTEGPPLSLKIAVASAFSSLTDLAYRITGQKKIVNEEVAALHELGNSPKGDESPKRPDRTAR
jgi:hypothetical protein